MVILGVGIGGVTAANELFKQFGRQHEIVVVDQSETYEFAPSYLWILSGTRTLLDISVPITRIARKGMRFQQDSVRTINLKARTVTTERGTLEADYLLIALGATTHMTGLEAVARAGHNLYSAEGVQALQVSGRAI